MMINVDSNLNAVIGAGREFVSETDTCYRQTSLSLRSGFVGDELIKQRQRLLLRLPLVSYWLRLAKR